MKSCSHPDACKSVWWSDQALGLANIKAHSDSENDGQKVGQSIRNSCAHAKDPSKAPDLEIGTSTQKLLPVELLSNRIAAIDIDTCDTHPDLPLVEEAPGLSSVFGVRKVDQEEVADNGDDAGDDALNDEDPTPSKIACGTIELHETVREDAGTC